ncbi:MAG: zinc-ribbon domain [Acidobacteriota bacterium]|nr:zinc-ribbon domain [Acidobacteriota bacterium]
MYCPRCAAQNLDDAKFCRACGTNLEAVALALSGQYHLKDQAGDAPDEKSWLKKRSEAVSGLIKGAGLLAASLLIGGALGLFSNGKDWIIVWVALAGWMACWGVIALTSGLGTLLESKSMLRYIERTAQETVAPTAQPLLADDSRKIPDALPPVSVTEYTTEPLPKERRQSKQTS